MPWTEKDVGLTPASDVAAHAMGWDRPVIRSDEQRKRLLANMDIEIGSPTRDSLRQRQEKRKGRRK